MDLVSLEAISMKRAERLVLVVDDEPDVRDSVCAILEDVGFRCVPANDGAAALRELERMVAEGEVPCVVLLDLMMPVMNGYDFRRQQKLKPEIADIPVIVFTAYGPKATAGVDAAGILEKPVDLSKLVRTLNGFCSVAAVTG